MGRAEDEPRLRDGQHIHFIGIGGAGLSAIARILLERGYSVSGSDLRGNAQTRALAADGARVFIGHDAAHVAGADIALATSAAPDDHVEITAARARNIPVYRRRDFMGAVLRGCDTIAVAGAHGKTTTTSMIIHILNSAGNDPSFIVGGALANWGVNAAVGSGPSFVVEADEYDNMFHGLRPNLAVVTNVEHDHPDFFPTPGQMIDAFRQFIERLAPGGELIACADDPGSAAIALAYRLAGGAVTTYGRENGEADWRASDLNFAGDAVSATLLREGSPCAELELSVPGAHNVLNALAAIAAAEKRGVEPEESAAILRGFQATARRFEIRGERGGVIVVDDYAHHPTEIRVNLEAARQRYPSRRIWAVWQPHTYSRVGQFWRGFVDAFSAADGVLVTPIYAAREAPIAGVTGEALTKAIARRQRASYAATFDAAVEQLRRAVQEPAIILIFSAGDANIIADKYLSDEG